MLISSSSCNFVLPRVSQSKQFLGLIVKKCKYSSLSLCPRDARANLVLTPIDANLLVYITWYQSQVPPYIS